MLSRQPIKLSDYDKSLMKNGELFNKYFCKNQLYPMRQQKLTISPFSHYKSMENLSCHSNEGSWTLTIKDIIFVGGNVMSMYAKFQLHPPYGF